MHELEKGEKKAAILVLLMFLAAPFVEPLIILISR